uniref:Caspase 20, apoptosis-related cysteine peptidase n=1 Tax=Poecilia latipinna TaxID=48699 RepID=A0A3B3V294_9TELE
MAAKETMKRNKTKLIEVLCGDYRFILNKVQEKKLITSREYNNLKSINREDVEEHVEGHVIELVDKIMNKGEKTCQNFLELLQTDDVAETYPDLEHIKLHDVLLKPVQVYELNSQPVGLCLIINNENFPNRKVKERRGTNKDAGILADVFSWLGFKVLMSAGSARRCLLCCILSHGSLHKVCGVDSQPLAIKEIRRYFVATKQPALTGKPKVFLIQACQGDKIQRGVLQKDAEEDSLTSIPEEADFLVAVSTVEDHVSFRDKTNGSWFIQSVCEQLKLHCPR